MSIGDPYHAPRTTIAGRHTDRALYHYTDRLGFVGIMTTGQLWATDALFLNDAAGFTTG